MFDRVLDWQTLTILAAVTGGTWTLAFWFSKQFSDVRRLIHSKTEQLEKFILEKIEYHEKHDDVRFHEVNNQLWEMKLQQALKGQILDQEIIRRPPDTQNTG